MDTSERTKAQLERAAKEIAETTPEAWLDLQEYIQNLEKNWPEAPCSINFRAVHPDGWVLQYTLRDFDDEILGERVNAMIQSLARDGYVTDRGYVPTGTLAKTKSESGEDKALVVTSPGISPDMLSEHESYPCETIIHQRTSGKGIDHLVVKGGNWKQYGYKAWPEVIPADFNFDEYEIGKEASPPQSMRLAYFSKTEKRVIAFMGIAGE